MSAQRNMFLQRLVSSTEYEKNVRASAPHFVSVTSEGNRGHRRSRQQRPEREKSKDEGAFMYYVPRRDLPSAQHRKGDSRPQLQINQPYPSQRAERTMLQQAWHIVNATDPLLDSDDENPDEHIRLDYSRRLHVMASLRRFP